MKQFRKPKSLFRKKQIDLPMKFICLIQKQGKKSRYIKKFIEAMSDFQLKNNWRTVFLIFWYFQPTFSYIIAKVDKKKRKNSRNRIKKYFFIWKYIPFYKRWRIFIKFFSKEIKFTNEIKLKDKIIYSFTKLFLNKPFFYKNYIQFAVNHIYNNLKSKVILKYLESR